MEEKSRRRCTAATRIERRETEMEIYLMLMERERGETDNEIDCAGGKKDNAFWENNLSPDE